MPRLEPQVGIAASYSSQLTQSLIVNILYSFSSSVGITSSRASDKLYSTKLSQLAGWETFFASHFLSELRANDCQCTTGRQTTTHLHWLESVGGGSSDHHTQLSPDWGSADDELIRAITGQQHRQTLLVCSNDGHFRVMINSQLTKQTWDNGEIILVDKLTILN